MSRGLGDVYKRQKINHKYIERKKFAIVINNATYLLLLYFSFLDLEKKIKIAPIVGRNIKDDKIGIFIILQLKLLIKLKNLLALQKRIDIHNRFEI